MYDWNWRSEIGRYVSVDRTMPFESDRARCLNGEISKSLILIACCSPLLLMLEWQCARADAGLTPGDRGPAPEAFWDYSDWYLLCLQTCLAKTQRWRRREHCRGCKYFEGRHLATLPQQQALKMHDRVCFVVTAHVVVVVSLYRV